MKGALKVILILLIILIILLILWLLLRNRKKAAGKHMKAGTPADEVRPVSVSSAEDIADSSVKAEKKVRLSPDGSALEAAESKAAGSRSAVPETDCSADSSEAEERPAVRNETAIDTEDSDYEHLPASDEELRRLFTEGTPYAAADPGEKVWDEQEDTVSEPEAISAEAAPEAEEIADVQAGADTSFADENTVSGADQAIEKEAAQDPAPKRNAPGAGFSLGTANQRASALSTLGSFSRIIALNIETPNSDRNSICNIGLTIGDTENCLSTNITINPEVPVEDIPDGMTEEQILSSPTLKDIWPGMSRLFDGALVIAHNASYDLTILKKALNAGGLQAPDFSQACTYRMSRKFHPEFDSYKLGSICDHYGIPLDVTNAVSHSDACFDIFCRLVDEGQPVFDEAKPFIL